MTRLDATISSGEGLRRKHKFCLSRLGPAICRLWKDQSSSKQVEDVDATKEKQEAADNAAKEAGKEAADPVEPVMKTEPVTSQDWVVQNDNKPLWTRSPKEVGEALALAVICVGSFLGRERTASLLEQ